jgi:hypothetical protein
LETGGVAKAAASVAADIGGGKSALFAARPAAKSATHVTSAAIQANDRALQMRAITMGT